jgi:hypothetical protein
VPRHQSKTVYQQFGAVCGNDFSVDSHSSNIRHGEHTLFTPAVVSPVAAAPSAPGASNDPDLRDFLNGRINGGPHEAK